MDFWNFGKNKMTMNKYDKKYQQYLNKQKKYAAKYPDRQIRNLSKQEFIRVYTDTALEQSRLVKEGKIKHANTLQQVNKISNLFDRNMSEKQARGVIERIKNNEDPTTAAQLAKLGFDIDNLKVRDLMYKNVSAFKATVSQTYHDLLSQGYSPKEAAKYIGYWFFSAGYILDGTLYGSK